MPVRVKVVRFRGLPCEAAPETRIDEAGGCIGRRDGSALVLANDPSVSREHGKICYENGIYRYHDTSSNGTRLVNRDQLIRNDTVSLSDGDILGIGDYELRVMIDVMEQFTNDLPASGASIEDLDALWLPATPPQTPDEPPILVPAAHVQVFSNPPAGSDPFMELLLGIGSMADDQPDAVSEPIHVTPDVPVGQVPLPLPAQTEGPSDTRRPEPDEIYRRLLQGAGLESSLIARDADHMDDRLEQVGRLLRAFVEGISLALQARADMKRQMRVSVTTLDANDNNPLKFSSSIDQMLELMLGMHARGFKDPVLAVKEGFDDLVNHQLAMSAGIQGSLLSVLKRFDPERIEQSYDKGLVFQKKAKCWEDYCNAYPMLVNGALEDIFGDEFAATYERQLAQLRMAGNKH